MGQSPLVENHCAGVWLWRTATLNSNPDCCMTLGKLFPCQGLSPLLFLDGQEDSEDARSSVPRV